MPDNVWRGDAQAIAQVGTLTFAGTMTVSDWYETVINRKKVRLTITADITTPEEAAAALKLLLDDFDETEFREVTWNYTDGDDFLSPTAADPGVPHEIDTDTNVGSDGTLTYVQTVGSEGPEDASIPENWSLGTAPANGETLIWPADSGPCRYGLDFTGITPAAVRAYSKVIGLPDRTGDTDSGGYVEYRNKRLIFTACADIKVGDPDFDSPDLVRIHVLSTSGTTFVCNCGGGVVTDTSGPPVRFTSAVSAGVGHTIYNLSGSLGLASGDGEGIKILALFNGTYSEIENSVGAEDESAQTHIGRGAAVATAATVNSGTIRADVAVTTVTIMAAAVWSQRSGVPTTVICYPGGTFDLRSGGTITTATFSGAIFDLTGSIEPVTVTTLTAKSAGELPSKVQDPHKRLKAGSTSNIITDRLTVANSDFGAEFTLGFVA